MNIALENMVSDIEDDDEVMYLYTEPSNLQIAKNGLEQSGLTIEEASLIFRPMSRMTVSPEIEEKVIGLIEKLEEMDDVQKVYTNLEFAS